VLRPNPLERDERRRVLAASLKRRGDAEFKAGRAVEAVELYTSSLDLERTSRCYSNRAAALLKIGRTHESERDCHRVLSLCRRDGGREDTTLRVKAFFRRALARQQLDLLDDAASDLESALLLEPENKRARSLLAAVRDQLAISAAAGAGPLRREASRHGADSTASAGTSGEWDRRLRQQSVTQTMAMAQLTEEWLSARGSCTTDAGLRSDEARRFAARFDRAFRPAEGCSFTCAATGETLGKTTFEKRLFEQRGTRRGHAPSLQIEVRNPIARCVSPGAGPHGVCIVAHEVCMSAGSAPPTRMRVTATFRWAKKVVEHGSGGGGEGDEGETKGGGPLAGVAMDVATSRVELVHFHESIIPDAAEHGMLSC
jgi:hypothetical protein